MEIHLSLRILFGSFAIGLLGTIFYLAHHRKMELRYGIFWMPIGAGLLLGSLFPQILILVSQLLGFETPSNAAMSLAIVGLIFVVFVQAASLNATKVQVRTLAQELALHVERTHRVPEDRPTAAVPVGPYVTKSKQYDSTLA